MEIRINGIKVALVKCLHCGQEPTEADASQAISKFKSIIPSWQCACCDRPIEVTSFRIEHESTDEGEPYWQAVPTEEPNGLLIKPSCGGFPHAAMLHLECGRKLFPNLNPEFFITREEYESSAGGRAAGLVDSLLTLDYERHRLRKLWPIHRKKGK